MKRITSKLSFFIAVMLLLQISLTGWAVTSQQTFAAASGPVVINLSPADDLVNVPITANLKITFDENVVKGSSSTFVSIYEYTTNRLVESLDVTSNRITIDSSMRTVTIDPTYDFVLNTDYYVLVDAAAFLNASNGVGYVGLNNASSWNFRTVAAVDVIKPQLVSRTPDSVIAPVTSAIVMNFDEPVYAANGNIQINSTEDVRTISVTSDAVRGSGTNQIIIQPPAALQPNTVYSVVIPAGLFQDASGNKYDGASWSFTTDAAPVNVAAASPFIPADNATSVPVNTTLTITFDRNVQARTGKYIEIRRVSNNSTFARFDALSSNVRVVNNQVTITPGSSLEANTAYYVIIEAGAFTQPDPYGDQWYHGIAGASIWNFSTDPGFETTPPVITASAPANNGVVNTLNALLQLTFNEPVFPSSGVIEIRNASNNALFRSIPITSERVTGGGTYQITIDANKAITGEAAKAFVNNTKYYVVIGNRAIRDAAGNFHGGITGTTGWTFTVTQDNASPTIIALAPVNNTATVPENTTFAVLFNEPIVRGAGAVTIHQTGTNAPAPIVANASVDPADNRRLLITPPAHLTRATSYYINIASNAVTDLAGNAFAGILNEHQWTFKTVGSDIAPPTVSKAESSGATIKLTYNEELNRWLAPSPASYYVSVDGAPRTVTAVSVSNDTVVLTLASPIVNGQVVKLSYTKPTVGLVQDLSGNQAASLTNIDVPNATDTVNPTVISGSASGSKVTLTFNKALAQVNSYAYTQFTVTVGSTKYDATSISSTGTTLQLTINGTITNGQSVWVSYAPGSYPIRDVSGNHLAAISSYYLYASVNTSGPVLQYITTSGSSVLLKYNENLNSQSVPSSYQYTVWVDNTTRAVSYVTVSGDTVLLSLSTALTTGQTVTVSYSGTSSTLTNSAGYPAPSFNSVSTGGSGSGTSGNLIGAIVKGSTITLNFNETLQTSSIPSSSLFLVKVKEAVRMVTKVEMSGSSITLTLYSPVLLGETVTISYFSSTAGIKANNGQLISTFTNVNVANQTSLFDGLSGDYESADGGGIGLKTSTASTSSDVSPAGLSATRYTISSEKFMGAYQTARNAGVMNPQIVFKVPSSERAAIVAVPIMALEMAYRQGSESEFVVQHGDVTYGLPLGAINYAESAASFNGSSMSNHILIEIDQGTSSLTTNLMSLLNSSNAQTISSPIHTKVSVINGSSEKEITEFYKYTSRTIKTSTTIDPSYTAVVWYDPQTGGLSYVPTEFSTSSGRTTATFKRKGNSSYVLIRGTSSFTDIGQHWAAATINTMARKLIVEGRTVTKFEPNKTITRGEFATYIAKGLGLSGNKSAASKFKDVNTNTAMGAYIGAASSAGIVLGNTNGTFKPNDPITRQEMAVMMMRAAKAADVTITLPSSAQGYLSAYSDRGKISSYAQTDVAKAVYTGIMNGRTNTTMSPLTNATRAEGTVMIMRLLEYIKFIS